MNETFWTLLGDPAHWAFEIFLMLLFDGLIAGLAWPLVRKHWRHHIARDQRDIVYNWGMSPTAKAAGHVAEDPDGWPEGICEHCRGVKAPLDGVDLCTGCGDIKVQPAQEMPRGNWIL